jgi:predicted ribosome quality control (RQC) complex YloA/Tae2 family protein
LRAGPRVRPFNAVRGVRYDSLLVRALATELHAALRGARLRSLLFDRDAMRVVLGLVLRSGRRALVLDLAAGAGWIRFVDEPLPRGNVSLPRGARIERVGAPDDERVLVFEIRAARAARIVVELMTNQWNVLLVGEDGRIVRALRPRGGRRTLRPGTHYEAPERASRLGSAGKLAAADWLAALRPAPATERSQALIARIAYTSPLNADYVLGPAIDTEGDEALLGAHERWLSLVASPPRPALLAREGGYQPYPQPLGEANASAMPSLLEAYAAGVAASDDTAAPIAAGAASARARRQVERLRRRAARLADELRGAAVDAARLRADADLLLAHLHHLPRGESSIELDDFAGGSRRIELDPSVTAQANAERLYSAARKRDRAAARLPALIARTERDAAALEAWADAIERGAAEVGAPPAPIGAASPQRGGDASGPSLPYRRYRTSGGLEVRVGRSGRANDELTLRHAAPNDVWLHARDVAGAHVVLRWADAAANPPQRDLTEAAVLAALHSRGRTSGVVAVDWTRRKYVRKPRKARPGLVVVERARTIFVEPDATLEERLSAGS